MGRRGETRGRQRGRAISCVRVLDIFEDGIAYHFEEAEEGGFTATVPALPGCISEGGTLDESLSNIRDAPVLYVEGSVVEGLPVPERYRAGA